MPNIYHAVAVIATIMILVSGSAADARAEASASSDYIVVIHHADLHPLSAKAARVMLDRIGTAALEACGGSSFGLRDVNTSVRSSQCWNDSVADVVARINDPMIQAAYASSRRSSKMVANQDDEHVGH